ncbi:hypothetical protein GQ43DRAFT_189766 [Delitschia confertaspora ATCC 74209]|uniref:Uncharacterized protein n=1 Tax=Delitschia confertaspora ATCC 74209 TaxID=1513339 RepID=A0A9P4MPB9_9PLEO|nr:hypothetical protein GQ43DRAFT_189766 [Delitschia confertaspora ATCC 74209]
MNILFFFYLFTVRLALHPAKYPPQIRFSPICFVLLQLATAYLNVLYTRLVSGFVAETRTCPILNSNLGGFERVASIMIWMDTSFLVYVVHRWMQHLVVNFLLILSFISA